MRGLETERLRLRCLENGWEIVPRSLGEPVGTILFERSEIKGFVSLTAIPHEFHNGENAAMRLNQYLQGKSKVELL